MSLSLSLSSILSLSLSLSPSLFPVLFVVGISQDNIKRKCCRIYLIIKYVMIKRYKYAYDKL